LKWVSPLGLDVTVPARPVTLSVTLDLPAAHAPAAGSSSESRRYVERIGLNLTYCAAAIFGIGK
jgi:hypothetical protein